MRKELLIVLSLLPLTPSCEKEDIKPIRPDISKLEVVEVKEPTYELKIEPLIEAMILVESEGNDSAYCKKE